MNLLVSLLEAVITVFLILLIARMIISLIVVFARDYQPTGPVVVVFESVMTATDPPLKFFRRFIPRLRIGQIQFDLAFLVLFIALQICLRMLARV
jgi:YggT family protein